MKMRLAIIFALLPLTLVLACGCGQPPAPPPDEFETTEYLGTELTPINEQGNNALRGTQYIEREGYQLSVDGLVAKPLSLSYDDLLSYPQESRLAYMPCVEGWGFWAKWTGPRLAAIFEDAGVKAEAKTVIFHCADEGGYTSLELDYILQRDIIIALKLNDVTLPPERGFPFQVVAEDKYGYKWAKWVTAIELSSEDYRGYWERAGYNNQADAGGPAFEPRE